jgi:hypothetical protein
MPRYSSSTVSLPPTSLALRPASPLTWANAPAVDLYLTTQFGNVTATRGLATSVVNGETATLPVAGTSTQFAITAAGATAAAYGPSTLGLQPNKVYLFYVVGSLVNNSLGVIAKDVSELK